MLKLFPAEPRAAADLPRGVSGVRLEPLARGAAAGHGRAGHPDLRGRGVPHGGAGGGASAAGCGGAPGERRVFGFRVSRWVGKKPNLGWGGSCDDPMINSAW